MNGPHATKEIQSAEALPLGGWGVPPPAKSPVGFLIRPKALPLPFFQLHRKPPVALDPSIILPLFCTLSYLVH